MSVLLSGVLLFSLWKWKSRSFRPAGRECRRVGRTGVLIRARSLRFQGNHPGMNRPRLLPRAVCLGRRPMRRGTLTIEARYVYPVEGPPIENGCLTIEHGRIAWVGSSSDRDVRHGPRQRGDRAGFCRMRTRISSWRRSSRPWCDEENEVSWLRHVVDQRRAGREETARATVSRNVKASTDAGTTLLADITTAGLSWESIAAAPLRAVVFAELIGLKRDRGLETSDMAWRWLGSIRPETQVAACARPGLSPHAPYSTAGWLYHKAVASRMPLSTHLAEMPEELRLLQHRDGPLRGFLEDLGAWDDDWEPIGPRPADYVRKGELRNADWLIAHGTYLEPDDFWQLRPEAAPEGHRVAVAFCPRTHARFGHAPHPYRALLERGAIVCLGTDSLASSRQPEHPRRDAFPARPRRVALRRALVDHGDSLRRMGLARRDHDRQHQARQVRRPGDRLPV